MAKLMLDCKATTLNNNTTILLSSTSAIIFAIILKKIRIEIKMAYWVKGCNQIRKVSSSNPIGARPGLGTQPRYEVPVNLRIKYVKRSD